MWSGTYREDLEAVREVIQQIEAKEGRPYRKLGRLCFGEVECPICRSVVDWTWAPVCRDLRIVCRQEGCIRWYLAKSTTMAGVRWESMNV